MVLNSQCQLALVGLGSLSFMSRLRVVFGGIVLSNFVVSQKLLQNLTPKKESVTKNIAHHSIKEENALELGFLLSYPKSHILL